VSRFYGILQGARGAASRCGSKSSGMETYCASWEGAIRCYAYYNDKEKQDWVRVEKTPWHGAGENVVLYEGAIGEFIPLNRRVKK